MFSATYSNVSAFILLLKITVAHALFHLRTGFKESLSGQQSSCDERVAALDKQVRDFLSKELKSQQSSEHTDVMVGYLRDMLLKVSGAAHSFSSKICAGRASQQLTP